MKRVDLTNTKEEKEEVLRNLAEQDIKNTLSKGIPVRTVDKRGVYDLYPNGDKVYVKLYEEVEGDA